MLLRDAIDIPEKVSAADFVLKLHEGVERPAGTVSDYVVTPALADAFRSALALVDSALTDSKDVGAFLHGSFGSGKSHFMAVLHLLLTGNVAARALPGLQQVVDDRHDLLGGARGTLLVLDYHLIGAKSFEHALFSGYQRQIEALHPGADLPVLSQTDLLFENARKLRTQMGDEKFFTELNAGGATGWAALDGGWTAEAFERAVASGDSASADGERARLASALVRTLFSGYKAMGEWLDIEVGLAAMAAHAKSLGYSGIVLFLDELVLWLASHLADQAFVNTEAEKVAKLVEPGIGRRAVPIVSFVARQRDLRDFFGDSVPGAMRAAVGDAFQWWEGRFDRIEIKASNLADVAQKRLLAPANAEGAAALAGALSSVKRNAKAWDALLKDEQGAGEADFAKVYPFSPALVDTLVALSAQLQRERTALKVMAQLLSAGRDTLTVNDVIPVGDLYDVMVEGGDPPLTDEMTRLFAVARTLYREKLRPIILAENGLDETTVNATDVDGGTAVRQAAFRTDDRLAKTLIISALAPVSALKNLTASRLAYLNYGTVAAPIAGGEVPAVLAKVKAWALQVGELEVGDGGDPILTLNLSGVDYEGLIERVRAEDNEGARKRLLRRMIAEQFGVGVDSLLPEIPFSFVWRGSKRQIDIVFGNIRDREAVPDDTLRANGETWRLIIDYPFDSDPNYGPQDDQARLDTLKADGIVSRTVAWIPSFMTRERQNMLGKLVLLEHLLAGSGATFDQHAIALPADQRPIARNMLESQRNSLRTSLLGVLRAAYGLTAPSKGDLDESFGTFDHFVTLDTALTPVPPVAATLKDALVAIADQMHASRFPQHPLFEPSSSEVTRADLNTVLAHVTEAMNREGGRVDPVETAKRSTMRRVANPLGIGECFESHYVFNEANFKWRNDLARWHAEAGGGTVTVTQAREWLAAYGMAPLVENLILCAWALQEDKQWSVAGAPVTVGSVEQVRDDMELRQPDLPDEALWPVAVDRAARLFGVAVAPLRSAANLAKLSAEVRRHATEQRASARALANALEAHRERLGLGADSPRLDTARACADLVEALASESQDIALVSRLAQAAVPDEPNRWSKSLSTAAGVEAAIRVLQWPLIDALRTLAVDHPQRAQAEAALSRLETAARADELHASLAAAMREAVDAAGAILAAVAPIPPGPGPTPSPAPQPPAGPDWSVDDIVLTDVESQMGGLADRIRKALEDNPGKKVRVSWWLE